jgi:hypothetical protein
MVLVSMLYSGPRQSFDVTSLLFSRQYTSLPRRVSREQREVLPKFYLGLK